MIATATDPLALARAAAELDLVEDARHAERRPACGSAPTPGCGSICGSSSPTSSATCSSTSPAPRSTTWRCATRRCARGCTCPSTGCSTTRPARPTAAPASSEVYALLGLEYIEPELRENRGELEAAAAGTLPDLIELGRPEGRPALPHDRLGRHRLDRGDGARGARRGLRVPGDHRPLGQLRVRRRGLARAAARADRADPRRRRSTGSSCSRARRSTSSPTARSTTPTSCWPSSTGSSPPCTPRSGCPPTQMTERIVRAIEHPLVDVIGHLSGRKIERRPPYQFDFERVIEAAVAHRHDARDQLEPRPPRPQRDQRSRRGGGRRPDRDQLRLAPGRPALRSRATGSPPRGAPG